MPWRVDQIKPVFVAVLRVVVQTDALRLDSDSALALQVHRIEHLRRHLALRERAGQLEQTIRQRRFAVVDVCNDAEIPDVLRIHVSFRVARVTAKMRVRLRSLTASFKLSSVPQIHKPSHRQRAPRSMAGSCLAKTG